MQHRILFVCLGNICRSPAAEAIFAQRAREAHLADLTCDSAGTGDWHLGEPPYAPMVAAAAARGIEMAHLRARQVQPLDFERFDLIVAMDRDNRAALEALRPAGNATPVRLALEFADRPGAEVPDPWYTRDFEGVLDLLDEAAAGLIAHLLGPRQLQ